MCDVTPLDLETRKRLAELGGLTGTDEANGETLYLRFGDTQLLHEEPPLFETDAEALDLLIRWSRLGGSPQERGYMLHKMSGTTIHACVLVVSVKQDRRTEDIILSPAAKLTDSQRDAIVGAFVEMIEGETAEEGEPCRQS